MRKVILSGVVAGLMLGGMPAHAAAPATVARITQQYSDDLWADYKDFEVPRDDKFAARAQRVGNRLTAILGESGQWKVLVFSDRELPPATALDGRRLVISKDYCESLSDNALAFVMAHEMGHVKLGHVSANIGNLLDAAKVTPGNWRDLLPYTPYTEAAHRVMEEQADAFGAKLATRAGFDAVAGAREVLAGMAPDSNHPDPKARVAALTGF
ncbi:M48 family metalloprotease [Paraburkholderia sp. UCT31]|uniref:M48 family metalloprotease n=1 Tax=Paraburkholderia sp. UCT31 TaxID=2615209 RepID=UPI0016566174|nr:M48 family metalloprotease [Paraburkholderia sp. UCT31]